MKLIKRTVGIAMPPAVLVLLFFGCVGLAERLEQTKFVRVVQGVHSGLSDEAIQRLRMDLIDHINADRMLYKLQPVKFDSLASAVADEHCWEELRHGYFGHFGLDGLKPYHRYALAGGYDYIAENGGATDWAGMVITSELTVRDFLFRVHDNMMQEKAPNDGHRRNILDPHHNYCGIGLAVGEGGLRFTEEFLNRYVVLDSIPEQQLRLKDVGVKPLWVSGHTLFGATVASGTVFYEPWPRHMSPAAINRTYSYGLPGDRREIYPRLTDGSYYVDGGQGELILDAAGKNFRLPVRLWKGKKGIYTLTVWVRRGGDTFPATNLCFFVR